MGRTVQLKNNLKIIPVDTSALANRYLLTTDQGRQFELSQKMTEVIVVLHETRDLDQAAAKLSKIWQKPVSSDELQLIVETYLKKWDLLDSEATPNQVTERAGAAERKRRFDEIYFRFTILPGSVLKPISSITRHLYQREISTILIVASVVVHYLVLRSFDGKHLAETIFNAPGSGYLTLYVLLLTCVLWHELGHASALAKFGKAANEIGFGIYFVFPVMYTDVSECWALKRWQRVIVDCGGIYFQAMTALPLYALYLLTGSLVPVFVILVNLSLIVLILNPVLKFDGYWLLADALGIINLREKSLALLAHYYRSVLLRHTTRLSERLCFPRSIKLIALTYGGCSSVLLGIWILSLIVYAPTVLSNYAVVLSKTGSVVARTLSEMELATAAVIILKLLLQTIPVFAVVALLYRLNKQLINFVTSRMNRSRVNVEE